MAAYVIVDVSINDSEGYEEYRRQSAATVEAYGGRFLVRGGAVTTLEGAWHPRRLVVLEFESAARAQEWWSSPEYEAIKPIRQRTTDTQMIVVEGLA